MSRRARTPAGFGAHESRRAVGRDPECPACQRRHQRQAKSYVRDRMLGRPRAGERKHGPGKFTRDMLGRKPPALEVAAAVQDREPSPLLQLLGRICRIYAGGARRPTRFERTPPLLQEGFQPLTPPGEENKDCARSRRLALTVDQPSYGETSGACGRGVREESPISPGRRTRCRGLWLGWGTLIGGAGFTHPVGGFSPAGGWREPQGGPVAVSQGASLAARRAAPASAHAARLTAAWPQTCRIAGPRPIRVRYGTSEPAERTSHV